MPCHSAWLALNRKVDGVDTRNNVSVFQDPQLAASPIVQGRVEGVPELVDVDVDSDTGGSHFVYGSAVMRQRSPDWPLTNLTLLSAEQRAWLPALNFGAHTFVVEVVSVLPTISPIPVVNAVAR